jgi:hypothetical protein
MQIWKHALAPAGTEFISAIQHTGLIDCPACKYGTLEWVAPDCLECIDCNARFTDRALIQMHILPPVPVHEAFQ